jgi:hypothetical protein
MSRRPARFTESDIRRALAAVTKSGGNAVVEIAPDGTIRLVPAALTTPTEAAPAERRIVL